MEKDAVLEYLNGEEGQGLLSEQGYLRKDNETIASYLDTEEGRALKFSIGDKAHNRYMEKMKEQGKVVYDSEGLKELRNKWRQEDNPTLTPEQVKIKELEEKFAAAERKEKLGNNYRALEDLNKEFGLPVEFLRTINREDFESSKEVFSKIAAQWKSREDTIREAVIKELKGESPKPGGGGKTDKVDEEVKAFEDIMNGRR